MSQKLLQNLTHCGRVMPYGNRDLGHHWLRQWLGAWHQYCMSSETFDSLHGECFQIIHSVKLTIGKCVSQNVSWAVSIKLPVMWSKYGRSGWIPCLLMSSLLALSVTMVSVKAKIFGTQGGRCWFNFREVIFKLTLMNGGWGISYEIALKWMPQDLTDVNIGSGNGLVPSGNTPLPEPMLTEICVAKWRH